jgi:sugar lactone lactonase YvrE
MTFASTARIFRDARSELSESPVYDPRNGEVAWVDITGKRVVRSPFDGAINGVDDRSFTLPTETSALGLTDLPGEFVVAQRDGVYRSDARGELSEIARIEHTNPRTQRLNDGKPDPFGNFVVGSVDFSGEPNGNLYRITPSGGTSILRGGFINANGLGWTADGRTIYFTDSVYRTVYAADYSIDAGLTNERVFATTPDGLPDGLTVDAEDHVWLASPRSSQILRFDPDGCVVLECKPPSDLVTSLEFVGPELTTLVITTTRYRMDGPNAASEPGVGALYRYQTPYTGVPANRFGQARIAQSPRQRIHA